MHSTNGNIEGKRKDKPEPTIVPCGIPHPRVGSKHPKNVKHYHVVKLEGPRRRVFEKKQTENNGPCWYECEHVFEECAEEEHGHKLTDHANFGDGLSESELKILKLSLGDNRLARDRMAEYKASRSGADGVEYKGKGDKYVQQPSLRSVSPPGRSTLDSADNDGMYDAYSDRKFCVKEGKYRPPPTAKKKKTALRPIPLAPAVPDLPVRAPFKAVAIPSPPPPVVLYGLPCGEPDPPPTDPNFPINPPPPPQHAPANVVVGDTTIPLPGFLDPNNAPARVRVIEGETPGVLLPAWVLEPEEPLKFAYAEYVAPTLPEPDRPPPPPDEIPPEPNIHITTEKEVFVYGFSTGAKRSKAWPHRRAAMWLLRHLPTGRREYRTVHQPDSLGVNTDRLTDDACIESSVWAFGSVGAKRRLEIHNVIRKLGYTKCDKVTIYVKLVRDIMSRKEWLTRASLIDGVPRKKYGHTLDYLYSLVDAKDRKFYGRSEEKRVNTLNFIGNLRQFSESRLLELGPDEPIKAQDFRRPAPFRAEQRLGAGVT
jgi:hypothetical protein